jgi:hypothetical protein
MRINFHFIPADQNIGGECSLCKQWCNDYKEWLDHDCPKITVVERKPDLDR